MLESFCAAGHISNKVVMLLRFLCDKCCCKPFVHTDILNNATFRVHSGIAKDNCKT